MADEDRVNWVLAVELVVVIIVSSAFLFYWNRVVGTVLAWIIRLITWRKYHAYVTIGSLQISPLAGRIAFRDLEYHSSNISFRALNGHVTWRYWKLRVRQEEDADSSNVKRNRLPTRLTVYAQGVEAFFFNRTPAYDAIIERMKNYEKEENDSQKSFTTQDTNSHAQKLRSRLKRINKTTSNVSSKVHDELKSHYSKGDSQSAFSRPHSRINGAKPTIPPTTPTSDRVNWFREALPMELRIVTGSVVLGSDSTPTILIGEFERADGVLHITNSKSICDQFKVIMDLKLQDPKVLERTNVDYSGPILAHGKKVYDELLNQDPDIAKEPPSLLSMFFGFHILAKRFPFLYDPKFSTPPVMGLPRDRIWRGLARYRVGEGNEDRPQESKREDREYAKVTTLLEAPGLDLTYYADTPGLVPHPSDAEVIDEADEMGNIEPAPEYGIDVTIHGGIIKYGPWADRQRDALQRTFAPAIFFDSEPKPRLKAGDTRLHTKLLVNLQFSEEIILRIPTREPSKDWQYDTSTADAERRYGWLDITAGANSSITYTQDQFATERGYDAVLVLHLDSLQIASSVNLEAFVTAQSCKLSVTMPTPLRWDARRDWGLDVTFSNPEVTLLRDHVTLISDLARDWSSGAVGDFHHFVPNHYNFRVSLINYAFHMLINDFNIVDRPKSRNENAFMDLCGPRIDAYVTVAATQYRPEFSVVPFSVSAQNARVELCLPGWDTHRSFGLGDTLEVGKIGDLTASGSYQYYSAPSPDHQETLILHLEGKRVVFKALGWVVRRMFAVKDNYFGGFTQFTTMQEFLERFDHDPNSVGDPVEEKYRPGRSDPYAVQVTMNVVESLILMSDEIYNAEQGLAMPVPQLSMSLKSLEHYMELSLDATPTYIVTTDDLAATYATTKCPALAVHEAIFLEGIELKANRLFGPQPRATTYLCLWECVLPRISAFLTPSFASTLQASIKALMYNFEDDDNAPASIYTQKSPPDATFFKLGIGSMNAVLSASEATVCISLPAGVTLDTSSLGSRSCSSSMGLLIPTIDVKLLRRHTSTGDWSSVGETRTGLSLDMYKAPKDWQDRVAKQQKFLREEDRLTQRIWYMYSEREDRSDGHHVHGVYLPRPRVLDANYNDDSSSSQTSDVETVPESPIPSSPEASDGDAPSPSFVRPTRTARRSRSFATARETIQASSAGDESDTSSEQSSFESFGDTSSRAEEKYEQMDMAEALAFRLKQLRTMRIQHLADTAFPQSSGEPGSFKTQEATSHPYGTVLRVRIHDIDAHMSQVAMDAGHTLIRDMTEISRSSERLIDALLIDHVISIESATNAGLPLTMDVQLPLVNLRVPSTMEGTLALPTTIVSVSGIGLEVARVPMTDTSPPVSSSAVKLGIKSLFLSLYSSGRDGTEGIPKELPEEFEISKNGTTVLKVVGKDVVFAMDQMPAKQQLSARIGSLDVNALTASISAVSASVTAWQRALKRCVERRTRRPPFADLLYNVVRSVATSTDTITQPAFLYESAYGLHVDDQRNIRRDIGWLILARLRHWLRENPPEMSFKPPITPDVGRYILDVLTDKTEEAGGNRDLVREQPFVQRALGSIITLQASALEAAQTQSLVTFIYVKSFDFRHYGCLLETPDVVCSTIRVLSGSHALRRSISQNEGEPSPTVQMRILVATRQVDVDLQNSIFPAAQSILRSVGQKLETLPEAESTSQQKDDIVTVMLVDAIFEHIRIAISAGGLKGRLDTRDLHSSTVIRKIRQTEGDNSYSRGRRAIHLTSNSIELALLLPPGSGQDLTSGLDEDRIILSAGLRGFRNRMDEHTSDKPGSNSSRKMIFGIRAIDLNSRPQLRVFSIFIRVWHFRQYPHYKDCIEQLKAVIATRPTKVPTAPTAIVVRLSLDLSIESIQLHVRAAKGLWVRWEVGKIFLSLQNAEERMRFGVRVSPQVVGAYPSSRKTKTKDAAALRLPSVAALGETRCQEGKTHLSVSVDVGFFLGILKPVVLDRLLSLHQKLGSDMLEVIRDYRVGVKKVLNTRHSKVISMTSAKSAESIPSSSTNILLNLRLSVAGIRFGLKADDVATTLLFEALALKGNVTNQRTNGAAMLWRAKAEHVGLSLGHLDTAILTEDAEPIRKYRSAYMVLDVDVQEIPGSAGVASQLNVYLTRAHTVMHVAALSELADLIRSWQADIHLLRESRSSEVAEVRMQTRKVLRKLEATEQSETSWFASRLLSIQITGIGLAIPLNDITSIEPQQERNSPVPAFLFSIRVVDFQNRRNETARFKVQQMALQFLHKFDQMTPEHFAGDFHPSRNRMILPSLDSEARMASTPDTWSLSAHCSASDFKLCLAPDMADAVFQLIDLYEQGKVRISQLERQYRADLLKRDPSESVSAKYEDFASPIQPRKSQRIMVRMSYTFNSGTVELYRSSDDDPGQRTVTLDFRGRQNRVGEHDEFRLPTVSVWVDYAGARVDVIPDADGSSNRGVLVVNSAVHESRNVLRPSILPFFVGVVNRVEARMKSRGNRPHHSHPQAEPLPTDAVLPTAGGSTFRAIKQSPTGKMRVRFTLRIDRSELRLSCAPDSNAYVDLKWESGGFLASATLGSDEVSTFAGTISGVTASLSHEFAEQGRSCIEAGAKDMAFSVTFCPGTVDRPGKGISVVLDTQMSAEFRLEAFSAWLIFTSVWIDNAPKLDLALRSAIPEAAAAPVQQHEVGPKVAVGALVRFRSIDFDANASVSRAKLQVAPIVLRTKSNGESTEVDLQIGVTQITAEGDISGDLRSDGLVFRTVRRSSRAALNTDPTVLSMSIHAQDLTGNLFLGDVNIVRFHLEPAQVTLADDWKAFTLDPNAQVFLAFAVQAGQFNGVLRLLAIPRLLGNFYTIFDIVDSQKKIAAQRSEICKSLQLQKTTDPSPMAAVILQTAKKAHGPSQGSGVRTAQTMRFDLSGIDVGVFNEDPEESGASDFYRFIVGKVEADLRRQTSQDSLPRRDLSLLVSSVRWDSSDGTRMARQERKEMTARTLIDMAPKYNRREVATLPLMTLTMGSLEYASPTTVEYDFDLIWGESDGDVSILPNFFLQAIAAFKKLLRGMDEQQIARARRLGIDLPPSSLLSSGAIGMDEGDVDGMSSLQNNIIYRPRATTHPRALPIPRLKWLGEGTTDAARLIPRITAAVHELPVLSHRFVTLPLEDGMDLLLKLYEKQLPERQAPTSTQPNGTNGDHHEKDEMNGTNGNDEMNGKHGMNGKDGENGVNGKHGMNGKDDENGVHGKGEMDGMNGKDEVADGMNGKGHMVNGDDENEL
ncbi:hypothetical protein BCR39DRAFT_589249 [Naematelia encephala]|uniref:Csf1 N-terminal domain-containing protein n=1 Tax=Naematelia encephala TaxID=71784 RepID=A0A1Y2AYP9_9TREE|nr:hypothetical protein BCR39DRAFT_589249 [Naematelia encephala]